MCSTAVHDYGGRMRISRVVQAWQTVKATRSRLAKVAAIATIFDGADARSTRLAVAYLSGVVPQGSIGLGYATVGEVDAEPAADLSLIHI